ncbi:MAG: hypothetical protein BGO98_33975 [Myxococcales bacterium 68-20]|nr:MAG: hypothetical protein BGO98_33975 [Myxococcales bacterium 68-20]
MAFVRSETERTELFHKLFHENFLYVCACLRRFGVHASDVEDAAHEVFLTAYRRLESLVTVSSPRPWLARIAYLTALSSRQRTERRVEVTDPGAMPEPEDHRQRPDKLLELEEERSLVLHTLQSIPADRRVVFVMHDIDGHDIPEIATLLSIPLNTAYSRLRLARAEFRDAIERATRRDMPLTRLGLLKG